MYYCDIEKEIYEIFFFIFRIKFSNYYNLFVISEVTLSLLCSFVIHEVDQESHSQNRSSRNQIIRRILTNIAANVTEYHIILKLIFIKIVIPKFTIRQLFHEKNVF